MIHLTKEEKADRFDSLQVAFKHTKAMYEKRRNDVDKRDFHGDVIGAYNRGLSDGYGYIIDDLERWIV